MLSWEYPPVVVGGIGRHVHALARRLSAAGHEVVVLCRQPEGTDAGTRPSTDTVAGGVRIVRVAEDPPHLEFAAGLVAWTLALGHAMVREGWRLLQSWRPDVVHAHDWLVANAAIGPGRHGGWLSEPLNRQVHSVEWWLANRADALITCSAAMRAEVATLFDVDPAAITVLHNGIDPRRWRVQDADVASARETYAPEEEPLLLFFGRLEWEKGV